jgi:hypothetical protein
VVPRLPLGAAHPDDDLPGGFPGLHRAVRVGHGLQGVRGRVDDRREQPGVGQRGGLSEDLAVVRVAPPTVSKTTSNPSPPVADAT